MVARQAAQIVQAGCRFQNFETLPALPVEALKRADITRANDSVFLSLKLKITNQSSHVNLKFVA